MAPPRLLYLILPLSAAWLVLSLYSRRKRRQAAEAFVAREMWPRIFPTDSAPRFWFKLLLREAGARAQAWLRSPVRGTEFRRSR